MAQKKVVITIDHETGRVQAEAFGFTGGTCLEKTKFLSDLYGVETQMTKPEFYQEETNKQTLCDGLPGSKWCG